MTTELAIRRIKVIQLGVGDESKEALDMAIEALEQEPILDKIRAEIEHLTYYWCEVNPKSVIDDVLQIIDKYKVESEDKK